MRPRHRGRRCAPEQRERDGELRPQQLEDVHDALLALRRQRPQERSPDEHRARTERERDRNVAPAADPAVDQHFELVPHFVDHFRKGVNGRSCTVELPPTVALPATTPHGPGRVPATALSAAP